VVGNLDQQFTDEDGSYINAGNSVVIRLTVEEQGGDVADGAEGYTGEATGQTIDMYLDMTLLKTDPRYRLLDQYAQYLGKPSEDHRSLRSYRENRRRRLPLP
jgi:hypothetical protein